MVEEVKTIEHALTDRASTETWLTANGIPFNVSQQPQSLSQLHHPNVQCFAFFRQLLTTL